MTYFSSFTAGGALVKHSPGWGWSLQNFLYIYMTYIYISKLRICIVHKQPIFSQSYMNIYIYTWSFKSTLISARANFCSRNPNLLVLLISARGTARFENNHFSNVRSFAGNCARLREIALVVRPVFFWISDRQWKLKKCSFGKFLLVMEECARFAKNIYEQANNQKLMLVWRSRYIYIYVCVCARNVCYVHIWMYGHMDIWIYIYIYI